MGVVNVTPDSFSDGGKWLDAATAIRHGIELAEQGADLVDVGGESTRPGAIRIDPDEELRRVIPVIEGLVAEGVRSRSTRCGPRRPGGRWRPAPAMLNDVSGGRADPDMMAVAAEAGCPIVLMHWREHSAVMQRPHRLRRPDRRHHHRADRPGRRGAGGRCRPRAHHPRSGSRLLQDRRPELDRAGQSQAFTELGLPVMLAASRKRFLGELLATGDELRPTDEREAATAAISATRGSCGRLVRTSARAGRDRRRRTRRGPHDARRRHDRGCARRAQGVL